MSLSHWLSSARPFALLGAAVLLSAGVASAQDAAADHTSQIVSSDSWSSSSAGIPEADFAAPAAGGGGQYDNRSATRGGGWHDKMALEFGGGFTAPTDESSRYIGWGGNVTAGAGLRFSKFGALMVEYQFIGTKLPNYIVAETGASGGNAHIWSLTLDPVINLIPKGNNNVYITGGGGFYRKVTNFTDPQAVQYCDYYYCGIGYQNQVVGHFSSNQGGWNAGAGISHRFGGMYNEGRMSVFAEARYTEIYTPAYSNSPNGLGVTTIGADTKLIPVTFGVRF